ncbi:MAG TPA: phytanoyl-CoA dioxygenase family protein [Thermoanaerobaculia bacterium]|jgi:ectoine hydroxylase-related dioxygenase (phytanoyl-CoA dioxygenase family)|nr:phytanoyl-CoA dioxygenase family protein [Thermoanaerobaculia bacterium]
MLHELSAADVRRYYDDGFLIVENLFSREEVAAMAAAAERLRAMGRELAATLPASEGRADTQQVESAGSQFVFGGANGSLRLLRVVWAGGCEPAFLACGRDVRLTSIVGQLLGTSRAVHLLNQLHAKYPHDGLEFEPHQDSEHRRYGTPEWRDVDGRGSYVQTVVAIDDSTPDNGPLVFYPGSGRQGHLDPALVRSNFGDRPGVPALLSAGSAAFFGPYVVHRSAENQGTLPRRIAINGFALAGANSRPYFGAGTGVPFDLFPDASELPRQP